MVKVRHSKGVAIHTDPESCAGYCREAAREALTGGRTGEVLSGESNVVQAVLTVTERAAPVAKPSVPRQILEVGADCVRSARSDLCGLRLASALKSAVCDDGRGKSLASSREPSLCVASGNGRCEA